MPYGEVTMIEVEEILRLWLAEVPKQRIGRMLGVDRKTVHRYTELAAELQLDTGWVGWLEPDLFGKRRRFRAWIFTAVVSRHRFVWPTFGETTGMATEACEEAWDFFGGIFKVLMFDYVTGRIIPHFRVRRRIGLFDLTALRRTLVHALNSLNDEMDQVILRDPLPQTQRQQHPLISVNTKESYAHGPEYAGRPGPNATTSYSTTTIS